MTCTIHAKFWQDTTNVDIKNENGTKKKKNILYKKKNITVPRKQKFSCYL